MPSGTHICISLHLCFPAVGSSAGLCRWPEGFRFDDVAQPATGGGGGGGGLFSVDHMTSEILESKDYASGPHLHSSVPGTQGCRKPHY